MITCVGAARVPARQRLRQFQASLIVSQRERAFLQDHRKVIAAMDFFTVPVLGFRVLYCFFIIEHGRRRILHIQVAAQPISNSVVQLRKVFPSPYCYVLLDRNAEFSQEVL
jgi:putative transposase